MSRSSLRTWLLAVRPWSFPASAVPALLACSHAWRVAPQRVAWMAAAGAIVGAVVFQAAGNLFSDYADYTRGVDREDTYGGSRLLVEGRLQPSQVLRAGVLLATIGSLLGLALSAATTPWLVLVGLAGVGSACAYTSLKYHALGDLAVLVTFGALIPVGTTMVTLGEPSWSVLLASLPLGLLIVGILHANNVRDIFSDTRAGIQTFASLIGAEASRWYYGVLVVGAYVLLAVAIAAGWLPLALALVLLSVPLAARNLRAMRGSRDGVASIITLDGLSAQLVMAFGLLMAGANVVATVLA